MMPPFKPTKKKVSILTLPRHTARVKFYAKGTGLKFRVSGLGRERLGGMS